MTTTSTLTDTRTRRLWPLLLAALLLGLLLGAVLSTAWASSDDAPDCPSQPRAGVCDYAPESGGS
jgi:peptidoglycan/LPS O-acetylase OafA/YrhL